MSSDNVSIVTANVMAAQDRWEQLGENMWHVSLFTGSFPIICNYWDQICSHPTPLRLNAEHKQTLVLSQMADVTSRLDELRSFRDKPWGSDGKRLFNIPFHTAANLVRTFNPVTSIVKGLLTRVHNQQDMDAVTPDDWVMFDAAVSRASDRAYSLLVPAADALQVAEQELQSAITKQIETRRNNAMRLSSRVAHSIASSVAMDRAAAAIAADERKRDREDDGGDSPEPQTQPGAKFRPTPGAL